MIGLAPGRKYRYFTDAQAEYVTNLVNARFAEDDDQGRAPWRERFSAVRDNAGVSSLIEDLKKIPTIAQRERAENDANRPTEEGLYRNPETGELYRLKRNRDGEMIISKYSTTGGPRRLVADFSKIEKGTWRRFTAFQSRIAFSKGTVRKGWLIDAKTLAVEYAYGFCTLHFGPLKDGISVALGYGKDCAEKYGLPWSQEAADAKIEQNRAAALASSG